MHVNNEILQNISIMTTLTRHNITHSAGHLLAPQITQQLGCSNCQNSSSTGKVTLHTAFVATIDSQQTVHKELSNHKTA